MLSHLFAAPQRKARAANPLQRSTPPHSIAYTTRSESTMNHRLFLSLKSSLNRILAWLCSVPTEQR